MPRPAPPAPRYCLSFTAAGLRPEFAAVIAGIHLEEQGDWGRTKTMVLERNALQARSASSGKRLESELRQRLQCLTAPQLQLLARGSSDERTAMAWLAVLKRIEIAADLTREVLMGKLASLDPVLRRSDVAAFYEDCERDHPELTALGACCPKAKRPQATFFDLRRQRLASHLLLIVELFRLMGSAIPPTLVVGGLLLIPLPLPPEPSGSGTI